MTPLTSCPSTPPVMRSVSSLPLPRQTSPLFVSRGWSRSPSPAPWPLTSCACTVHRYTPIPSFPALRWVLDMHLAVDDTSGREASSDDPRRSLPGGLAHGWHCISLRWCTAGPTMASVARSENTTLGSSGVFVSVACPVLDPFAMGLLVQDVPSPRTPDVPSPHTPPELGHWWYAWDADKA